MMANSDTVSAIRTPEGFDATRIVTHAADAYGVAFGVGLGEVAGNDLARHFMTWEALVQTVEAAIPAAERQNNADEAVAADGGPELVGFVGEDPIGHALCRGRFLLRHFGVAMQFSSEGRPVGVAAHDLA